MYTIIGAGLSGLYAAYLLHKQNIPTVVLEASSRVGGRIRGHEVTDHASVELGPSWFWPHQHHMRSLCQQFDISTFNQYIDGEALYQIDTQQPVQRFYGTGGMISFRVAGGLTRLIRAIVNTLPHDTVKLNSAVTTLERRDHQWHIETTKGVFKANKLIVATPPRIALEQFSLGNHLPESLTQSLRATPTWMAAQAKFVATYSLPFWRKQGLSGDAFSRVGPMVEIHDASVFEASHYALFGFIGLSVQQRQTLGEARLRQACINQLVTLFGHDANAFRAAHIADWSQSEFTCTQSDIDSVPAHPHCDLSPYYDDLGHINLSLAGTEVAESEAGYLEGAIIAAKRAVEHLIHA